MSRTLLVRCGVSTEAGSVSARDIRGSAMLVRQTLALPESEPIQPQQLFFYDLGFTSMDLLDLLFRIEQHFRDRDTGRHDLSPRAWRSRGG